MPDNDGQPSIEEFVGWFRRIPNYAPPGAMQFAETIQTTGYTTEEGAIAGGWRRAYMEVLDDD